MEDFQDLLKELEDIKVSQRALALKETLCKEELMAALKESGLDKQDSPYGTVRIQRRAEKDYGDMVTADALDAEDIDDDLLDIYLNAELIFDVGTGNERKG